MNIISRIPTVLTGMFLFLIPSLLSAQTETSVEPDTTFNQFFTRSGDGFTGGDGTYSVQLPDGRNVWIFGDTFLGIVNPDSTRKKLDPMYIRNSFVVQDKDGFQTLFRGGKGDEQTLVIPPEVLNSHGKVSEDSVWYWPGDAFVDGDKLRLFLSKFRQVDDGMWGFEWAGTAVATFSLPEIKQTGIHEFPSEQSAGVHFGHAIFEGNEYTYIYGLKDGKPYGARFSKGEIFKQWEYYTTGGWSEKNEQLTPVLDVGISEQFSVVKLKGAFYLVSQLGGFSNEIWAYQSAEPFGWSAGEGKRLYTVSLPFDNKDLFTYNAIVHPQFIDKKGRILISYNTNSFRLQDHFENAHIYKPRFIRIPLSFFN